MVDCQLEPLGDAAILLRLGDRMEEGLHLRVQALAQGIRSLAHPAIRDVVPTFAAVTVHLDPLPPEGWSALEAALRGLMEGRLEAGGAEARVMEIPVRYGGEDGPDLEAVALHTGLGPGEVVRRHAAGLYRVHFLGFSPGFPYLGGLDPALATPRRSTPRLVVPAGSVGIGGAQTGVYPQASPGGWNLIGRTLLPLFDPEASEPCLLRAGDQVRFVEVL